MYRSLLVLSNYNGVGMLLCVLDLSVYLALFYQVESQERGALINKVTFRVAYKSIIITALVQKAT